MTPQQYKTILTKARQLKKDDDKADNALKKYWELLSSINYAPFVEKNVTYGYLEAIEDIYGKEVYKNVSYWVYDVPDMAEKGKVECKGVSGKTYDVRNLGSYIKFLLDI